MDRSLKSMMKRLLLTCCASLLILLATAVPSVQMDASAVRSDINSCGIIERATKVLYTGEKPRGWKLPGFDDSSWSEVSFPLAESIACFELQSYGSPGGGFPPNQRIITRNTFTLSAIPLSAKIVIVADNFARVFVNGVLVFTTPEQSGCPVVSTRHSITLDDITTTPFVIGENVVAVNAQDYDGRSFLSVQMKVLQTPPCDGEQLNADLAPPYYYEPDYFECDVIDGPTKALLTGEKPRGWKDRDFYDLSWTDVSFPLADNVSCPQLQAFGPPGGLFPQNTRIVTRNTFYIPAHPDLTFFAKLYITADNLAKVFVNGVFVFQTPDAVDCEGAATVHEVDLPLDDTMPLVIGRNVVAVNAQDYGGEQSFVNVRMVIGGSQPCDLF